MGKYKDLSGMIYGRWTVESEAEPKCYNSKRIRYWNCVCDCGSRRAVSESNLVSGASKSCGCYHNDIMHDVGKVNITHGQSKTRLYRIYKHMLCRCNNKNDIRYAQYGGRGISVCKEWLDFENFFRWANESGYDDTKSIDRIDVNADYSPLNCKWSTAPEQAINKTTTIYLDYNGEHKCLAEWARELGMPYKKLYKRIYTGWSVERALTT